MKKDLLGFEQLLHGSTGGLSLSLFKRMLGDDFLQVKIQSISKNETNIKTLVLFFFFKHLVKRKW